MRVRIFATRRIPDAGLDILKRTGEVEIGVEPADELVPRERLLEGIGRADVLVSLLTERIDREALEAGKHLRGVANYAVGFNNIDIAAATALGLPVTNTPGVLTDTTQKEHYARRAVELLTQARDRGFFQEPAKRAWLQKNPELEPLRSRDDFQKLLAPSLARIPAAQRFPAVADCLPSATSEGGPA